jgi:hypothetical protein
MIRLTVLFASILILGGAPLRAGIIIGTSPQLQSVTLGSVAEVQIGISGLGNNAPPSLGAYDLNFSFNPAVVAFSGLTFGDPLLGDQLDLSGAGTIADFSSPSAGLVEAFEISLDSALVLDGMQPDHFVLMTLQFTGLAAVSSTITPSLNSIGDSVGAPLAAELQAGQIDVVGAPEPGSFWMLSLGALGLIGCAARARSKRAIR